MVDTGEAEAEEGEAGGAAPLGRGFPLIQVCAEGERGGQKTDILQLLLPMGGRGYPWRRVFSLATFLKTFFASLFSAFLATHWLR